jgi:uncharacterized phiE125 gp8 family phage protein
MRHTKAYPYAVTTPPEALPLSPADVKTQLKLDPADNSQDEYLSTLIAAATDYAERYTRRDLLTRSYITYRDCFYDEIELRRCPVQSVRWIKYLQNGAFATVDPASYYNTVEPDGYTRIALYENLSWPQPVDNRLQAVQIAFTAGYGDAAADLPQELRLAILQHTAQLYAHRGDNDFPQGHASDATQDAAPPAIARALYDKYRIIDIY